MNFLSLFSGVGGIDLGLERAGMRCVGQVEINPFCRAVLAKHWPDVPRFEDVRTVTAKDFCEPIDVIAGGFPCKQTSTAAAISGNRHGLAGRDSGLWHDMLRIIDVVRPQWCIVENVAGVRRWAGEITRGLEAVGYEVSRPIISAARVGAPHLRRRVFFVANVDKQGLPLAWQTGPFEADGIAWGAADRNTWLSSLSRILRVADGVPARMDRRERIVALGNAVVPQVAEFIGRRIVASLASTPTERTAP